MSITAGIIALLVAIVPFVLKWIWASKTENATPEAKYEKRQEESDQALANRDAEAVNVAVTANLDRLRALRSVAGQQGNTVRPAGEHGEDETK